jgi:hypothetical protein
MLVVVLASYSAFLIFEGTWGSLLVSVAALSASAWALARGERSWRMLAAAQVDLAASGRKLRFSLSRSSGGSVWVLRPVVVECFFWAHLVACPPYLLLMRTAEVPWGVYAVAAMSLVLSTHNDRAGRDVGIRFAENLHNR